MPLVDVVVESTHNETPRMRQVEAMFDVPPREKETIRWNANVPIDKRSWNVGLIVGPSGAGKSTVAKALFGESYHPVMNWDDGSVIDAVAPTKTVKEVTECFSSVGFNTIPAWRRRHDVLSMGEKFRVDLARRLLELPDPIVVDEFSSVVDRQVAKIGAHAVQKHVRKNDRRFVAVTCHYDVEDWLQPDWVLEPSTMAFRWRCLQRRPPIEVEILRVRYDAWSLFAPYHYLTASLQKSAACFAAVVDGMPAAFSGMTHFPHPKVRDIRRCSRLVTLPDWQGLGLAFALMDTLGAAYKTRGLRARTYPAHPSLIRSFDRSRLWALKHKPATGFPLAGKGAISGLNKYRPCAVFEYVGPQMDDVNRAARLLQAA